VLLAAMQQQALLLVAMQQQALLLVAMQQQCNLCIQCLGAGSHTACPYVPTHVVSNTAAL
jgi:hypothetical protein